MGWRVGGLRRVGLFLIHEESSWNGLGWDGPLDGGGSGMEGMLVIVFGNRILDIHWK